MTVFPEGYEDLPIQLRIAMKREFEQRPVRPCWRREWRGRPIVNVELPELVEPAGSFCPRAAGS